MSRVEIIGAATLHLGNCLEIIPTIGRVSHMIGDPPYEKSLHDAKNAHSGRLREDGGSELKGLDFAPIDEIRQAFVDLCAPMVDGWFIAFCTVEGTHPWAAAINASAMKYKRACAWVKPDSTPQLNGQGPAQGYECFVCAWAGAGVANWNAGGKRGVYTHNVNNPERDGRHPTEKPRRLMAEILGDFTQPGQLVGDFFMGSGTTGVAAVQMGRRFIGIEKDPTYFDIACSRLDAAQRQASLFGEPVGIPRTKPPLLDLEAAA